MGGEDREEAPIHPDLLPDAAWKKIQQNTFTRWVNNHLQKAHENVDNLATDLSDGLKLIALVEVLSLQKLGRYNKKVSFRSQKLENVSLALNFLQDHEAIKIINIDSSHIVDGNLKLILGLIWTLILHYSISMQQWAAPSGENERQESTPKQRLLAWLKSKMPSELPITNFTSDWNDGVALGALVDSVASGLLPNWRDWEPRQSLENTRKAMKLAQEQLGIAPLLTAEELLNPNVDEKSVMTYLAQFPQAKYRPVVSGSFEDLDEWPVVNESSEFRLRLSNDNHRPLVRVSDPDGGETVAHAARYASQIYNCVYTPTRLGAHDISLSVVDPVNEEVRPVEDATKRVTVVSPPRVVDFGKTGRIGETKLIRVENVHSGNVDVVIVDGEGAEHKLALTEAVEDGVVVAEYTPKTAGHHSVNILHRNRHLLGSPFPLRVVGKPTFSVWGRGVAPKGVRVGDRCKLHVEADDSQETDINSLPVQIRVTHDGVDVPISRALASREGRATFEYTPTSIGAHTVDALVDGDRVKAFEVDVASPSSCLVRAFGPGLEGGIVDLESVFFIETHGDANKLEFAIEGPKKTEISCADKGDGSAIVSYVPHEAGEYRVSILSQGEHIQDSPFVLNVDPADPSIRPSAVRVFGLESERRRNKDEKVDFRVETQHAGDIHPSVSVLDSALSLVPVDVVQKSRSLFDCSFTPTTSGRHYVNVAVKGVAVPGAPFPVEISEPVDVSKVRVFGPGVEEGVRSQSPTHFTIDAKQAGAGEVEVNLADRNGNAVDLDVFDNGDGSFTVKYTAPRPGPYQLKVVFAGAEVPKIEIEVKPQVDLTGIRIDGLDNALVTVNCEKEVHVFTWDAEGTRIVIRSPSGRIVEALLEATESGIRVRFTPSEIGDYSIDVSYQDLPIEGGPFLVHSVPPSGEGRSGVAHEAEYIVSGQGPAHAELVRVSGPGLGPVVATRSSHVHIDASRAGFGNIDLFVDGPAKTPIHCVDNADGTCSMFYVPRVPGIYWLRVLFDERHVPGSPFQVVAVPPLLAASSFCGDREDTTSPFPSLSSGSSTPHSQMQQVPTS